MLVQLHFHAIIYWFRKSLLAPKTIEGAQGYIFIYQVHVFVPAVDETHAQILDNNKVILTMVSE